MSQYTYASVEGKMIRFSNLNKMWFPEPGLRKKDVILFYREIAPVLLPYLKDRPLTLKRYPDGVLGGHFYEKRCPSHHPKWVRTMDYRDIEYCTVSDLPSLLWTVNMGNLEFHPMLTKVGRNSSGKRRPQESADFMVFDLDPGTPAGLKESAQAALKVRTVLEENGLHSFPKTSGQKGVQVYVPLNSGTSFDETKSFSRELANALASAYPEEIVAQMKKALRPGKVYVDWAQNDANKSTACVYSLRAIAQATVSTPLKWSEVEKAAGAPKLRSEKLLSYTTAEVLKRIEKHGDLFEKVLTQKQKLPAALAEAGQIRRKAA